MTRTTDRFEDLAIFGMANNHQGSVEHGLSIIESVAKLARSHDVNAAVKLQYREQNSFIQPGFKAREDVSHNFEEVSTTANKNDSHFEDDRIAKLDPMERKTALEDF
jgi:hypothetical protein